MFLLISAKMLIDNMDRLEGTTMYKHELKNNANRFFKSLLTYTNMEIWSDQTGSMERAADQLLNMAIGTEQIVTTMIKCKELIPEGQQPLFWKEVNVLAQKFSMPVMFSHEGDYLGAPSMKQIVAKVS